jgi:DNA-binding MarR family transcriptional regulator
MAVDDHAFYERFDSELTELIRLARDPRLTDKMVAGTDAGIDRHLYVLLNLIHDRGPVRARDLLPIVAVDQSTLSRQISSLADHGLVERTPDAVDRRAVLVDVTDKGRAAISAARCEWQRTLAGLMADWPTSRRTTLLRSVMQLVDGLRTVVDISAPSR